MVLKDVPPEKCKVVQERRVQDAVQREVQVHDTIQDGHVILMQVSFLDARFTGGSFI